MSREAMGTVVLRLGIAIVMLWFGFSQLMDGASWVSWVPAWAVSLLHIPPALIVLLNGTFEVVAGTLLAIGVLVRPAAVLLALHLAVIAFDIGPTGIGVRDIGLMFACAALAILPADAFTFRGMRNRSAIAAS